MELHAVVHGHVQGVSFRYFTQRESTALGLTGWVRNLPDGTVEVLAHGPRNTLDRLLEWLHHGPSGARVTQVEPTWNELERNTYTEFGITYGTDIG